MDWTARLNRDGPAAWRAAYRLLGSAEDADDCLQEAVLAAVQLSRREPVTHWRALLIRLTSARAVDRLRQRYRSRVAGDAVDQAEHVPVMVEPGEQFQLEELRSQLRTALAQLPAEQATAFSLCVLEEWTYAEAGTELNVSVNTIGVLVHRARQQLRELLSAFKPMTSLRRSQS